MKTLFLLASKSAWGRRGSLILAILSITISLTLLLGVDMTRKQAKNSFLNTISQTDLIVGARSGPVNLLLYSVFRLGNATNNISYDAYERIRSDQRVKWTIPLSLGDSHKSFRVLGTTEAYFQFYRYADKKPLSFSAGKQFHDLYDAVVGSEVAKKLGYDIGQPIILSHGAISTDFAAHKDKPFRVVGILESTGTPVDRSVHVSLEAIEAIHIDWRSGARSGLKINAEQARNFGLKPKNLTAVMVGLNRRVETFVVQRNINDDDSEALLAIIPGATLSELWRTLGHFENILLIVSSLVLIAGLLGMLTMLLSTLNERRREMAVLRAVGAHAYQILLLFMIEAFLMVLVGCLLSIALLFVLLQIAQPILLDLYGFNLSMTGLDIQQWVLLFSVLMASSLLSLIPGFIAYKRSLQDGLMVRL